MRLFSWSFVLGSTSALVLSSAPAMAGIFSVGGTDYEVQSIFGTWEDVSELVEDSPWWDDLDVALEFASTVQDAEGLFPELNCSPAFLFTQRTSCYANSLLADGGEYSPFFAVSSEIVQAPVASREYDVEIFTGAVWAEDAFRLFPTPETFTAETRQYRTDDAPQFWAYAMEVDEPQDVPEPATLVGLLGLAGVLLGVKRQK